MSSVLTFAKIALRNLFSPPATSKYPFEPAVYPKGSRGHVEVNMKKCIFCGLCASHCPTETIKVDRKSGTWTMNRFDCVQCQNCVNVCPKSALSIVPGYFAPGVEKLSETFTKPEAIGHAVPSVNDDKCVKCGWCGKKCPKGAITVTTGKSWKVDETQCIGCGLCSKECAFGALEMEGGAPAASGSPVAQVDLAKCKLCGLCARNCPNEAITVDRKAKTWTLNAENCVGCGACQSSCHFDAITIAAAAPAGDPVANADMSKCKLCGLCAKNCPNEAITVDRQAKTWTLNAEDCVGCGACQSSCHFDAITIGPAAAPAAPAEEKKEEAPAAANTKTIALPGRRPFTVTLNADGDELPVPGCTRPEYNDEFTDLPQCDREICKYCGLCMKKCPKAAIEVGRKEKFWEVENAECVRCGVCAEACPFGALKI